MTLIIDSSVALKWLVPEEDSEVAAALVGEADLVVPTLFHAEVANALWKKVHRGEIILDEVLPHLAGLPELVRTLDETALMSRALSIAAQLDHPIYDCVYLALAESLDEVVLTADLRLLKKIGSTEYAARAKGLHQ